MALVVLNLVAYLRQLVVQVTGVLMNLMLPCLPINVLAVVAAVVV